MKTFVLFIFSLFSYALVSAQSDSLTVVQTRWKVEKIARGVKLKQFHFHESLFKSSQNITIIEIRQGGNRFFDLAYDKQLLRKTSDFGKSSNSVAALNGTFFDINNGGSVDYLRSNGALINDNRLGINGRAIHQKSAILINKGRIDLARWDGKPDWEHNLLAEDIMVSGPLLIFDDRKMDLDTANSFNKSRHPRSALAITKNKRVLLVTVDGRNVNSGGMSLFELSNFLRWVHATDAINLDGGGSTTLWVNGPADNGVLNYPSDNKKWDHEGERKVANVLLLLTRPKNHRPVKVLVK